MVGRTNVRTELLFARGAEAAHSTKGMKMTYGQTVAARGPEIAAAEIDRLQRKIVAAQQVVEQNSKASAILFLDEHQWSQSSYAAHQKGRRTEERRVGKECVSTCRCRRPAYH